MIVKIKKLNDEAILPKYAHDTDAGMDLTAIQYEYDMTNDCHIYHTGLAFEIPEGHVGLIFPRSSNRKTESYLANSVGVIDSGYRGEVLLCFKNRSNHQIAPYKVNDRIGQIIILPYPKIEFKEVDKLSDSERNEGGFGSTGK